MLDAVAEEQFDSSFDWTAGALSVGAVCTSETRGVARLTQTTIPKLSLQTIAVRRQVSLSVRRHTQTDRIQLIAI